MNAPAVALSPTDVPGAEAPPWEARTAFFHDVLAEWLADEDITLACGRWADGAVSEIMPAGQARLLPPRYEGCFAGVREIRLNDADHHLHIDLGRVHQVCYAIAPSVCLGFAPALEVRWLTVGPGGAPTDRWCLAVMPMMRHKDGALQPMAVARFLERARRHAEQAPGLVALQVDPAAQEGARGAALLDLFREAVGRPDAGWREALAILVPDVASAPPETPEPVCLPLLEAALELRDASLVIYRDRTLVEFQTEKLDGVHRYEEHGHVSWQIGGLTEHHCHLALGAVVRVLFAAEPAPCQGGGLNYTVWFLTGGPSGNPWRRDGYFSVVLNRPYEGNDPRTEVIAPVLALYRRFAGEAWVEANEAFLEVCATGAPTRRKA